jgi:tetratricopeptide (TPR) repeat protein
MSEEKIVTFDSSRRRPSADRFAELAETARRLQRERSDAPGIVAHHLDAMPRDEWPRLAEEPDLRTSGALEQLATLIRARCEKQPQEALILSTLATTIAETLSPSAYPSVTLAQLRAQAWKDRAHTLRYLGRFDEAFEAIDMAESALAPFPATAYDKAVVALVKASTLQHVARFDESRSLLAKCQQVFRDHGDSRLESYCSIMAASLLYRMGEYAEAQKAYERLLQAAVNSGDLESTARLHHNLASCAIHLGQITEGKAHVGRARTIFFDLGRNLEALRGDRAFARLVLANGDVTHAIVLLRVVRREFLEHQLVEEAGLTGLSIAEALVARGDFVAAVSLVREIIDEFESAQITGRACQALESLQRSLDSRDASSATVRHVEQYIESLRFDPDREFVALSA